MLKNLKSYCKQKIIPCWVLSLRAKLKADPQYPIVYKEKGFCPICSSRTIFQAKGLWFRDLLLCLRCETIPRERALFQILTELRPDFKNLNIHESSPSSGGVSLVLKHRAKNYSASQFYPNLPTGVVNPNTAYRCENLEQLTFPDNSFDVFITQDVLEHVFNPDLAFKEIARVLKPGGIHIFTVPLVNKANPTVQRVIAKEDGTLKHVLPPSYHSNPVDPNGSLVTFDWGFDIVKHIKKYSGLDTEIVTINNLSLGIQAEFIEILISHKNNQW